MASGKEGLRWAVNCSQWKPTSLTWCRAMASVQREERHRINQFVFAEDAALSLAGRLLLRAGIVKQLQMSNSTLHLERTAAGKPCLQQNHLGGAGQLHFNVSHQGHYAVLATAWDHLVGVDVMQFSQPRGTTLPEFFRTMRRQFTEWEWQQIHSAQDELALFYRFWCLKESYIKALGVGLSHGLQRLEFTIHSPWSTGGACVDSELSVDGSPADCWVFEESLVDSEHCVSVAVNRQPTPRHLMFEHVCIDTLQSTLDPLHPDSHDDWQLHSARPRKNTSTAT